MRRPRHVLPVLLAGALALACTAEPKAGFEPPAFDPSDPIVDTVTVVASITPGAALPGLTRNQAQAFQAGLAVFTFPFVPSNGLGPLFNANACGECHEDPVVGGPGDEVEVHATAFHPGAACDLLEPTGGPVVQQDASPELQAQGILLEPVPAGATGTGRRSSPAVFGLGLLDAVSDRTIIFLSRIRYPDGVHGRPAVLPNGRVGRFGRKASTATLTEFNAGAFSAEMGLTNRLHPQEGTIAGQPFPAGLDVTPEPEIDDASLNAADLFVRFLAPVAPAAFSDEARRGRTLFREIRCTSCHVPVLLTGPSRTAALRFKWIRAYTDLLLHDLGDANADICDGVATPNEFRTQPLMGIRFQEGYMHDGAAETIEDAIQRHGGEATTIRDRFFNLIPSDQAAVVAFVLSL
jgi:CxxC motif-containing protein (DUF1111 family)